MTQLIFCAKLKKDLPALEEAPIRGPLGEKIQQQVSAQAWDMWINHQTMLINEYRLSMIDPKSREFLKEEMEKFLFGEGSDTPSGYIPEE